MADEGAGAALLNDLMNDRQRTRCPTSVRRADTLADQGAAGAGVPIDRHEVPSILGGRLLHSRRSWSKLVLWAAAGAVGAVPMPFHIGLGAIETSLCPPNGWISFGFVVGSSARHALHRAVADARDGPTRVYASPRTALARPRARRPRARHLLRKM